MTAAAVRKRITDGGRGVRGTRGGEYHGPLNPCTVPPMSEHPGDPVAPSVVLHLALRADPEPREVWLAVPAADVADIMEDRT